MNNWKDSVRYLTRTSIQTITLCKSNWYSKKHEKLAEVILRYDQDRNWQISNSTKGDTMNMYVSARELAYWEYLHVNEGNVDGKQIVPKKIISLATELQTPSHLEDNLPQNGFYGL